MKFSIHLKLVLSYIAVVLIIGVISMSFVYIFSRSFLLAETKESLSSNAQNFAREVSAEAGRWSAQTQITDLQNIFRRNIDENTSLVLADANFIYIESSGMNADHLNSPGEFVAALSRNARENGSHVIRYHDETYAVHIQEVYNATLAETLGYVILFTSIQEAPMQSPLFTLYWCSILASSILAVAIALLFSTQLTKNIKKLTVRANNVSHREFEDLDPVVSNDEVGELAQSIDRMAASLKEYDLAQKTFLQNASHEFRTPLMSIRGYAEGVKDGVFSDTEQASDRILEQVARLEKLVGEVIYLSKIENADTVIKRSAVQISDLTAEAVARVDGIALSAGIQIDVSAVEDIMVFADEEQMVTVLTNILSNGLRFARKRICMESQTGPDGVRIRVIDDGPGISETDLAHLFERFYKGSKGKNGLGLSIANAIVLAHGGTLTAYNRTDEPGAVFEILLPAFPQESKFHAE